MKLIIDKYAKFTKTPSDKYPNAGQLTAIGATFWIKDRESDIVEGEFDYAEVECTIRDNAPIPSKLLKLGKGDAKKA